jgi:uncharacterized protein involved in exopolysaccharide biosynthesis
VKGLISKELLTALLPVALVLWSDGERRSGAEMSPTLLTGEAVNLTLRDLTLPLVRRKRVWIPTFLGVFLVAAVIGSLRPQIYESRMSILISREGLRPSEATEMNQPLTEQEVTAEAESLKSNEFLERVVRNTGLQNGQDSRFISFLLPRQTETVRIARAVRQLGRQIQIHTRSSTHLIDVTYRSTDPSRAYQVLNSLGNLYLSQKALASATFSSSPQSRVYEAAMEDAESGLREFQRSQGRPDTARDLAGQLAVVAGRSRTIEHAIAVDEQRIRADQEQMKGSPFQPASQQGNNSLLLQNLSARLQAAEAKRAQFLQRYAPDYPLVQDAYKEVSDAEAAIAAAQGSSERKETPAGQPDLSSLRERLARDQMDLAAQRASLTSIRHVVEELKAQMLKSGSNSVENADLEGEIKADEQSYLRYLSRREQERTAGVLDRPQAVSAAFAKPPAVPASPVRGRGVIFLVALGLAAAVSFPAALILDCLDPCFHTPNQVIETLGIAVVLAVPKMTA